MYAEINSYDDALAVVRRLKAQGAHSVKNYNQPRREQRQMVVAAAQAENMEVVPEGGSLFTLDMSLVQDGNSTVEHNVPLEYFYADVVSLWSQTERRLHADAGRRLWRPGRRSVLARAQRRVAAPAALPPRAARRCSPRRTRAARSRPRRIMSTAPPRARRRSCADKGVPVAIGAHGQQAGLGAHWEMWSFVRGGFTPVEALRAGTIASATSLGYAKDVGSLEPGKLADLVVLDADPTRRHPQQRQGAPGDARRPAVRRGDAERGRDRQRKRQPYWWEGANGGRGTGVTLSNGHGHGDWGRD